MIWGNFGAILGNFREISQKGFKNWRSFKALSLQIRCKRDANEQGKEVWGRVLRGFGGILGRFGAILGEILEDFSEPEKLGKL